jgi:multidrug efflux system outer membrane protein
VDYRDIFRDPRLQGLIERALANNRDLRIAAANIASARAQYRVQRAALFPRLDAGAGVTISDRNDSGSSSGSGTSDQYSVDLGITSWEIDLFGRVRNLSKAALQQFFATETAARATRLTLVSDVADAYLTLAADQSLLAIARQTESNAARAVALTLPSRQAGLHSIVVTVRKRKGADIDAACGQLRISAQKEPTASEQTVSLEQELTAAT